MLLTRAPQPQHCFQVVRASAIQSLTRELAPWVEAGELGRYLSFYETGGAIEEDPFEKLRQAHKPQLLTLLNQHVVELEQQRLEEVNQRNLLIAELEARLNEEKRLRVLEMDDKARRVGELEGEIAGVVDGTVRENTALRHTVSELRAQVMLAEQILRDHHQAPGEGQTLCDMVARLVNRERDRAQGENALLGKADACIKTLEAEVHRLTSLNSDYESKEKEHLSKIVRLRDERGRLRECQAQLSAHLDDIFRMTSQLHSAATKGHP